jgi:lipopolysaccharide biosynthesis glycosyltransferase
LNKKKNVAIVLGSTKNYFFAIGSLVLNIKKFSPDFADDILIYYDEIADCDRKILVDDLGCTLLPYTCPLGIHQVTNSALQRFSLLSFSIYEIFKHLDKYSHVLWLDGDICIQDDISDIIQYGTVGIRYGGTQFDTALGRMVCTALDQLPNNTDI